MALSILDGNQSATTLSTILTSGQHITAHTVVSLGTQAITDMRGAVSGSVVSISNFPATQAISIASVTVGNSVTVGSLPAISGTVAILRQFDGPIVETDSAIPDDPKYMAIVGGYDNDAIESRALRIISSGALLVAGTVTIGSALPAGTNRIGVVTIGAGTVTIGAGTAQIGSVTASISGTVPISISSVTVGNSVTIGSLPAISGTVTANVPLSVDGYTAVTGIRVTGCGSDGGLRVQGIDPSNFNPANLEEGGGIPIFPVNNNPLPISGTVTVGAVSTTVTIAHHQGTTVTTSTFTSTTASTTLASANASREVLTIFNEGAGNLHICAGVTCTTIAYQVRLSAGDYYEVPLNQTSLTHSAVFATAGTARVTQIS